MQTSSKVTEVTVRMEDDGSLMPDFPITLAISDMELSWDTVYWNEESDLSLAGNKRSNIRGYDMSLTLDYNMSLEPDKVETILDNILNLIDADVKLLVSIDGTDYVELIPTSGTNMRIRFNQTVREGGSTGVIPALHFTSTTLFDQVGDTFKPLS